MDRPILKRAERQRPLPSKTAEHVTSQTRVARDPRRYSGGVRTLATSHRAHPQGVERQIRDRRDERDVLEEGPVPPHDAIEIGEFVLAEPRPEHQQLTTRDHIRWVELQVTDVLDCPQDPGRARTPHTVQQLTLDREPTRLGERDAVYGSS
jgi:hypothetical protein